MLKDSGGRPIEAGDFLVGSAEYGSFGYYLYIGGSYCIGKQYKGYKRVSLQDASKMVKLTNLTESEKEERRNLLIGCQKYMNDMSKNYEKCHCGDLGVKEGMNIIYLGHTLKYKECINALSYESHEGGAYVYLVYTKDIEDGDTAIIKKWHKVFLEWEEKNLTGIFLTFDYLCKIPGLKAYMQNSAFKQRESMYYYVSDKPINIPEIHIKGFLAVGGTSWSKAELTSHFNMTIRLYEYETERNWELGNDERRRRRQKEIN